MQAATRIVECRVHRRVQVCIHVVGVGHATHDDLPTRDDDVDSYMVLLAVERMPMRMLNRNPTADDP